MDVRLNGRVYEAALSVLQHRRRFALYHSAFEVTTPEGVYTIERAPELIGAHGDHGAAAPSAAGCSDGRRGIKQPAESLALPESLRSA